MTGCPSIDIAAEVAARPELDFDPFERYGGVGPREDLSKGYLVVMQHPVTTEYDEARQQVDETLYAVKDPGCRCSGSGPTSTPARTARRRGSASSARARRPANFHFFRNMLPEDFLRLLCGASAIVGNSSVAIRECSFLGVPAVNIGSAAAGPRARAQRDRRRPRSRGDCRRDSRAPAARPARRQIICTATAARATRIADALARARAADREAADLLMTDHGSGTRAERIAALAFDYDAQPKTRVERCNLCGGRRSSG